jgi:hypothetical protein
MDIGAALVTHAQAAEVIEPGQRSLDHPAVAAQALAGVDALAGNTDPDVPLGEGPPAAGEVIALVSMEFGGPLAPPPSGRLRRWDGIEQVLEDDRVVAVGPGQECGKRDTGSVDHNMALRARFAAIRRIRSGELAPLVAGMLALSRLARLQSIWPASPRRFSSVWCSRSQTPVSCQSRSLRQQVMPEPQPSSWGSISQGMPDFSTKMIPVKAARSGTRGRPPLGLDGGGGSSGSTMAQRSSGTSGVAIHQVCHLTHPFC